MRLPLVCPVFLYFFFISLSFGGNFPHLLLSPERLAEIRDAVEVPGSSHAEMLLSLQNEVDANFAEVIDGGTRSLPGRNYARGFLAKRAAMLYAVTEDTDYAEIAFNALEAMYVDPLGGNVLPDGLGGKGLERATVGKAFAVAYDLAYHGWSEAQRNFVRDKMLSSLDYWQGDGFNFDNNINPYGSNWVAVCYGSNLLQMLVLGEQENRQSHYDLLVNRLHTHMGHYGDKGWTQEGNYYMTYGQQFLIPAIHALQRAGDTRLDARLEEKGMYLIPMFGGMFDREQRSTQWGVGGSDFGRQGWTSLIFSIVPEEHLGAYRWFYDRHRGILNEAPLADRYDPNHAGTVYAMMFYPESVDPVDPASLLPKGLHDSRGGYWFRSGWQDDQDLIAMLATDTTAHGNAWDEADALQVSILGFGDKFAGGPGTSRDGRFFSQVTVDGQARASQSGTGTAEFFEVDADGGYAIAGGGSKFGGLGIGYSRRHLKVSFPDEDDIAVVSTFDILDSVQLREYAWQINSQNLPLFIGEEDGVPTFTIRGQEGGYLKGWVMYPQDGSFFDGNRVSYSFEANDAEIWVVMAMGNGAAPSARIEGEGLDAEWILGQRRLSWNAAAQRIESAVATDLVSGFFMTPESGVAPLTVSFDPTLTGGNPQWDFGDGHTSSASHPEHTFQNGGVFPVTLVQEDGAGGIRQARHYVTVSNNSPLAVLHASPDKGEAPLTVSFDASASSDPDGHALTFTWDFGDGSPSATGAEVSHTYTQQGTYFASVVVEDGHGGAGGAVQRIEVGNQAPTAVFTHSSTFGIPPVTVYFDASGSSDPEEDALTFSWDFGDGQTGSGMTPSHTFTDYGSYEVELTVNDGQGNAVSTRETLRIENLPPVPAFTFTPNTGNVPLQVTFDASESVDPEGEALTLAWNFGDGSTGSGLTTSHTFTEPVNTQVQLRVTDAQGESSTLFKPISILDTEGRRAPEFVLEDGGDLLPGVFFQLYNAAVWRRFMGDINTLTPLNEGVLPTMDIRFRQQADEFAFRFTGFIKIPESGSYTFHAQVRDNLHLTLGGLEVLNSGTGKKFGGPVTVQNTVGLSAGYHAFEARFHASDSNAPDWYPLLDLSWEGPEFDLRPLMPEDLFWSPGRPVIDFMVSVDPAQVIPSETVNFVPEDPVGTRTFYQVLEGEPLTLNFEGGPSSSPDGEIVRYLWDFGNDAVGAGRTVSQTYAAGEYVVTLTVETESGATFTTGQTLHVLPPPERLDFGRDPAKRVSANGQFLPNTGPENLFDGSTQSRWLVNQPEGFVEVHFETDGRRYGYVIDEYTLTNPPAWNDRDPREVIFSGTMDGVNWEVIDIQTNIDWQGETRYTKSFPVVNDTAYTGYRWDIVPQAESPQGWFVELYRIQLFGGASLQPEVRSPEPAFEAPALAEVSQSVLFDAGNSVSPDGYPLIYYWDFGDGQTAVSTHPQVEHRYYEEGLRQVRLSVRDPFGNLATTGTHSVSVESNTNQDPVAAFTVSQDGNTFLFDASASFDPDGDPITFRWDFGNGISSVGMETAHVFSPGTYAVTLTVTDDRGGRATHSEFVDARPAVQLDVISINFTTGFQPLHLHPYEYAGGFPARFWNNRSGSTQNLVDNQGQPVPLQFTAQRDRSFQNNTTPVDTGNARLLATSWTQTGTSANYTLSNIPYDTYDIYVYFAGSRIAPPQTQRIRIGGTSRFIRDTSGGWNGLLEESTATSAGAAMDGPAFVVFRDLAGDEQSIVFDQMGDPGPAAIQVVNTGGDPRELPLIVELPAVSILQAGQSLGQSTLEGGKAEDASGVTVSGTFSFSFPDLVPPLGQSQQHLLFTPDDVNSFLPVTTPFTVNVEADGADLVDSFSGAVFLEESGAVQSTLTYGPVQRTGGGGEFTAGAGFLQYSQWDGGSSMFTADLPEIIELAEDDMLILSLDFRTNGGTGGHRVLRFGIFESGEDLDAARGFFVTSPNVTWSSGNVAQFVEDLSLSSNDFLNNNNPGSSVATSTASITVESDTWTRGELVVEKTAGGYILSGRIGGQALDPRTVSTGEVLRFDQLWFGIRNRNVTFDITNVTLTVSGSAVPEIINHPQSQTVNVGDPVTFSVTAEGEGALTYQWFKDGNVLTGETGSTLTFSSVDASAAGAYTVVVSSMNRSVTSEVATLHVPGAPVIVNDPEAQTVVVGSSVNFSVSVAGTPPFTYEWYGPGGLIPGAGGDSLTLSSVGLTDAGNYYVRVSNAQGSVDSAMAQLMVTQGSAEERFLINFGDSEYTQDSLGRTWQSFRLRQNAGQNSSKLEYTHVPLSNTAGSDAAGIHFSATSSVTASMGFQSSTDVPEAFLSNHPFDDWFMPSEPAQRETHAFNDQNRSWTYSFSGFNPEDEVLFEMVIRRSGSGRWIDLVFNPGEANEEYLLEDGDSGSSQFVSYTVSGADRYEFELTGKVNNFVATINAMSVTVNPQDSEPVFTVLYHSAGGSPVSAQTYAAGDAVIAPHDPVRAGYVFAGWHPALPSVMPEENLVVTAIWTMLPPVIAAHPQSVSVMSGDSAGFSVDATGAGVLSYQWFRNGESIPGANEPDLHLDAVTAADAGNYSVEVENNGGVVTSSVAVLEVLESVSVQVTFDPNGGTLPQPSGLTVQVGDSYGSLPVTVREGFVFDGWFTDGGQRILASTPVVLEEDHTLHAAWREPGAGDSVFYVTAEGNQRFNGVHRLSDGSLLIAGQADGLNWIPSGVPVQEIAATGIDSAVSGRIGFLVQVSETMQDVLQVVHFPAGTVEGITHIRSTEVPGADTGNLYISGLRDNGANEGFYVARLNQNFVDGVPTDLVWARNVFARNVFREVQPWDVRNDGRVVVASGRNQSGTDSFLLMLDADTGEPVRVDGWRRHYGESGAYWQGGPASEYPHHDTDPIAYSKLMLMAGSRGGLRSTRQEDFDTLSFDGQNSVQLGRYPDDLYFAGPTTGGRGYTGYRIINPAHGIGQLAIDRRNNHLYFGGNVQTNHAGNQPDFEPHAVAMDADGEMLWWSRLYTSLEGADGVNRTEDGALNWTARDDGLENRHVRALAWHPVDPNIVYAGTYGGIFKSNDGGDTWNPVNSGFTADWVLDIAIAPSAPDTVYAATNTGIFKSVNGGGSWAAMNNGLTYFYVTSLTIHPANADTVLAGTARHGVFRSDNGGANWSPTNNGLEGDEETFWVYDLVLDPENPETVFMASGGGNGVSRSVDGGANWEAVNVGLNETVVFSLAVHRAPGDAEAVVYAGTRNGVFRSVDSGATWAFASGNGDTFLGYQGYNRNTGTIGPIRALLIHPDDAETVYAGHSYMGVFKSSDGGANWSQEVNGLPNRGHTIANLHNMVYALAMHPADPETLLLGSMGIPRASIPDQYVDAMVVDYSRPAGQTRIGVVARSHGNDVANLWDGDSISLANNPHHPGFAYHNRFTGTMGDLHLSWIGKLSDADGRLLYASRLAENPDQTNWGSRYPNDSLLDGWPDRNAGWPNLNTTTIRNNGHTRVPAFDGEGRLHIIGIGRRTHTTANAWMKMANPSRSATLTGVTSANVWQSDDLIGNTEIRPGASEVTFIDTPNQNVTRGISAFDIWTGIVTLDEELFHYPSPGDRVRITEGVSAWNRFVRVYSEDLSTLAYSSVLTGDWDRATGEGGDNIEIMGLVPGDNGLVAVGFHRLNNGNPAGKDMPTQNPPAWGGDHSMGESPVIARLDFLPETRVHLLETWPGDSLYTHTTVPLSAYTATPPAEIEAMTFLINGIPVAEISEAPWTVDNVFYEEGSYLLKVRMELKNGNLIYSMTRQVMVQENPDIPGPPGDPTVLSSTYRDVELSWTAGTGALSAYVIERAVDVSGPWETVATVSEDVFTFTDWTVSPDSTFFYRVRSQNFAGVSNASNLVEIQTDPLPLGGLPAVAWNVHETDPAFQLEPEEAAGVDDLTHWNNLAFPTGNAGSGYPDPAYSGFIDSQGAALSGWAQMSLASENAVTGVSRWEGIGSIPSDGHHRMMGAGGIHWGFDENSSFTLTVADLPTVYRNHGDGFLVRVYWGGVSENSVNDSVESIYSVGESQATLIHTGPDNWETRDDSNYIQGMNYVELPLDELNELGGFHLVVSRGNEERRPGLSGFELIPLVDHHFAGGVLVLDDFEDAVFDDGPEIVDSVLNYGPVTRTSGSGTFGVHEDGWLEHSQSGGSSLFTAVLPIDVELKEGDWVEISLDFRSTGATGGHRVIRFGLFESGMDLDAARGFFVTSPNATWSAGGTAQLVQDLSLSANDFLNNNNPGSGVRTDTESVVVGDNIWTPTLLRIEKTETGYRLEGSIGDQELNDHTVDTEESLSFDQLWFGIRNRNVTFDIDNLTVTVSGVTGNEQNAFEIWLDEYDLADQSLTTYRVRKGNREVLLEEAFLLGENPHDPNDFLRIRLVENEDGIERGLLFNALPGRAYVLEHSEDLVVWQTAPTIVEVEQFEEILWSVEGLRDGSRGFYRIRVMFPE